MLSTLSGGGHTREHTEAAWSSRTEISWIDVTDS
ncbi:hypothetical protein L915_12703 [Phytophthora nicotianae]|uniref:Uncharacterized protein n=1 Tax=Phytophthora nicotianae TaxID=4792 RepID=W2GFI7_PHYNI|nr:hypothetical protein L915_12703 [Phytophthora nicotianae]